MKRKKILPKVQRVFLINRGQFLLSVVELEADAEQALFPVSTSLTRISRFSSLEIERYISSQNFPGEIVFSTHEIVYKKDSNWKYIDRTEGFTKENFEMIAQIFQLPEFVIIQIYFDQIVIWKYSNGQIEKEITRFDYRKLDISGLNNQLFDPQITFPYQPESVLDKKIEAVLSKYFATSNLQNVFLIGEATWAVDISLYLHSLFQQARKRMDIYIDKSTIVENLMHGIAFDNPLKYLHKSNFVFDLNYFPKSLKTGFVSIDNSNRKVFIEKNAYNIIALQKNEILDLGTKSNTNLVVAGKGKSLRKLRGKIGKYRAKILARQDTIFEFDNLDQVSRQSLSFDQRYAMKIFDYINRDNIRSLEIKVLGNEFVKKGQKIALMKGGAGLINKSVISPADGIVNLQYINWGYIFIKSKQPVKVQYKSKMVMKIRPRMIIGKDYEGVLGKDIIYVTYLDAQVFHKFIQEGAKAILCDQIQKQFLFDILDYKLDKLCYFWIIKGVAQNGEKSGMNNYLSRLKGNIVICGDSFISLYFDKYKFSIEDISSKKYTKYRVGDVVEVIDDKYWGMCARITSLEKDYLWIKPIDNDIMKLSKVHVLNVN